MLLLISNENFKGLSLSKISVTSKTFFCCNWLSHGFSVTIKKRQMSIKVAPKMISLKKLNILTPLQKLPKMWAIWAKLLLPQTFIRCPKCNKTPNPVTLVANPKILSLFRFLLKVWFKVVKLFRKFKILHNRLNELKWNGLKCWFDYFCNRIL